MDIKSMLIPYTDRGTILEGYAAYPSEGKHPAVILCHAWRGRDDYICGKADLVAGWGYVGFALDVYGKGVLGNTKEENAALKKNFMDDRAALQARLMKALETVCALPNVDSKRIAVLGFGFGGVCALDFARSGADLKGAISVYGHFEPPEGLAKRKINAKILVLHGYEDPIATQAELLAFEKEMTDAGVDWQVHLFGHSLHAFTNPAANDPAFGTVYNPISAQRAWTSIKNFLEEVIGPL